MTQAKPKRDELLEPYRSELPQASENTLLSGAGAITEATRFTLHRWSAYASYFDKLAKCGNVFDALRLQATFLTDMQRDYANQAAALVSTATLTGLPAFARDPRALVWPPQESQAPKRAQTARREA
ncbi:MAG TPA: hypothetical protein VG983_08375 [Caulobacterales bacterium]|jgi:hypothetical protein|nr:hypothetical protein [Caulobacterales bacterium]